MWGEACICGARQTCRSKQYSTCVIALDQLACQCVKCSSVHIAGVCIWAVTIVKLVLLVSVTHSKSETSLTWLR